MCTAITMGGFAGRNLDVDRSYREEVIITPRNYNFKFKKAEDIKSHYAIIGMGTVNNDYPLYFDAANEQGLYIAGLNYVGNAKYHTPISDKINLAPYELIPYLLSDCSTVKEAEYKLERINLTDIPFDSNLPTAELHFFISDKGRSITVEPDADGIKVYDNPVGVLTNNPSFPIQLFNLSNYQGLSPEPPENRFFTSIELKTYSHGMGAIGLPGDLSSQSRFVRAAFHRSHSQGEELSDIMRILSTVQMPEGSVQVGCGFERTEYSSAIDLNRLIYSYRVYESPNTYAVKMRDENLDGDSLISYELKREKEPYYCNGSRKNINI